MLQLANGQHHKKYIKNDRRKCAEKTERNVATAIQATLRYCLLDLA